MEANRRYLRTTNCNKLKAVWQPYIRPDNTPPRNPPRPGGSRPPRQNSFIHGFDKRQAFFGDLFRHFSRYRRAAQGLTGGPQHLPSHATDPGPPKKSGTRRSWADSVCREMRQGSAARICAAQGAAGSRTVLVPRTQAAALDTSGIASCKCWTSVMTSADEAIFCRSATRRSERRSASATSVMVG